MKIRSTLAALALLALAGTAPAQNSMLDKLKNELGNGNSSNGNSGSNAAAPAGGGGAAAGGMGAAGAAMAQGLGLSMPQIGSSTMGNAAGVLQYCVKNNYLSADAAGGVKDKLLGMVTGQKPQQAGYANGAKGLLQGSDGSSFNLKNVGAKIKTKACDYVLANAKSLI